MTERRRCSSLVLVAAALVAALPACAPVSAAAPPTGRLEGTVSLTRSGKPAADASGVIIYVTGFDEKPPKDIPAIRQKSKRFVPDLVAITAGQSVAFPNDDPIFHNVFSTSKARKFDLGQYKQGQSKDKSFPNVGVIDVFCNIHHDMAATILVLPNRRFARAAADGSFAIDGIPEGTWPVYAFSRRAERPIKGSVTIAAGAAAHVDLALDETRDDFDHPNKFGEPYRDPGKYR